jgi:hypothetical protein
MTEDPNSERIKVCRKESKESQFLLRLLDTGDRLDVEHERAALVQEAVEFVKTFSAILRNSESA